MTYGIRTTSFVIIEDKNDLLIFSFLNSYLCETVLSFPREFWGDEYSLFTEDIDAK